MTPDIDGLKLLVADMDGQVSMLRDFRELKDKDVEKALDELAAISDEITEWIAGAEVPTA